MRSQNWRAVAVATVGLFAGVEAQTGSFGDLGTFLSSQTNLSMFYSVIQKYPAIIAQLPSADQGMTILAPSNAAFDKIPYTELNAPWAANDENIITHVMQYHILKGKRTAGELVPGVRAFWPTMLTDPKWANVTGGQNVVAVKQAGDVVVFISGQGTRCTLTQGDLTFNGGVVQVIDSLLIPPTNLTGTTQNFNLTSFQGALYASQQIANFSNTPNFTVFAPNNAGFQALGSGISKMTAQELSSIFNYHVLPNQVTTSAALKNGTSWTALSGGNLTVRTSGNNNVYINSAQLLDPDILIANGVLHVIDNVLNPSSSPVPNPSLETQLPAFAAASAVTNLPFTSAIPCSVSCPVSSTSGVSAATTAKTSAKTTTTVASSSSKALGVAMARETGFAGMGKAGLMVALGGAVMLI